MPEARRYAYVYAVIDLTDNLCVHVFSTTSELDTSNNPEYIRLESYNEEYLFKYYSYDTHKWYEDAEFTIEWIPS